MGNHDVSVWKCSTDGGSKCGSSYALPHLLLTPRIQSVCGCSFFCNSANRVDTAKSKAWR